MEQPGRFSTNQETLANSYSTIYETLSHLREVFHRSGRFDDSNAKLDEVAKLFSAYTAYRRGIIKDFPKIGDVDSKNLIPQLQNVFREVATSPYYLDQHGNSIFGPTPSLLLRAGDEALAEDLLYLVQQASNAALINHELNNPFDVLNEAFGHFVRDNFRSNIEDAQYLTPPEVVNFMVELAITDIENTMVDDGTTYKTFIVADPACGVGSFLTAFYHRSRRSEQFRSVPLHLVAQDKVERMGRLAMINLAMFDAPKHSVLVGNSLLPGSHLDVLNGKVDLILTNPPFGAKFNRDDIMLCGSENLPLFHSADVTSKSVDSELLFIDRNLALLKEGGRLLIVLPDSSVSARGLPSMLRQNLRSRSLVHAIVELPPVTFAQAGTRTKTVVLYLQKLRKVVKRPKAVFVAKADSLGFEVNSRKGVQVKVPRGKNDLLAVAEAYKRGAKLNNEVSNILSEAPSAVLAEYTSVVENSWTPNHYNAVRFKAIEHIQRVSDVELVPLKRLVEFQSKRRKAETWEPDTAFISVLHVISEGMLDISAINSYSPKTPGYRVHVGEVLLSRINPRIPRVLVVPELAKRMLCSAEFEIMIPRSDLVSPFALSFLLVTDAVQDQIRSLTSGTSASHNRIKTKELAEVKIPLPRSNSPAERRLHDLVARYEGSIRLMLQKTIELASVRQTENFWER